MKADGVSLTVPSIVGVPGGKTSITEVSIPWRGWGRGGVSGLATRLLEGSGVIIRHLQADAGEWHSPANKQLLVVLAGYGEVEAGDGGVLSLSPGSVFLMDHQGSEGHFNRTLGPSGLVVAFLPLNEDTDVAAPA